MKKQFSVATLAVSLASITYAASAAAPPSYVPPRVPVQNSAPKGDQVSTADRDAAAENLGSVGRLNEMRDRYVGKLVTVRGDVDAKLGANAFVLENGNKKDELVVVASPRLRKNLIQSLKNDAAVQVKGTVRELKVADLKSTYHLNLSADQEKKLAKQKTLVEADLVEPSEGNH